MTVESLPWPTPMVRSVAVILFGPELTTLALFRITVAELRSLPNCNGAWVALTERTLEAEPVCESVTGPPEKLSVTKIFPGADMLTIGVETLTVSVIAATPISLVLDARLTLSAGGDLRRCQ